MLKYGENKKRKEFSENENKKLLSVIAAASLAMTSFAALAVTASAADHSAYDLIYQFDEGTDIILNAGDTIYAYEVDTVLSVYDDNTGDELAYWLDSYTIPGESSQYIVVNALYLEGDVDSGMPGEYSFTIKEYEIPAAATATYAQVGKDYEPQFDGDKAASLWKVTVTPGSDAITTLSVEVNGNTPDAPLSDTTLFSGKSEIVFGVVLNGIASDFNGNFVALVNGEAVTTTAEATVE